MNVETDLRWRLGRIWEACIALDVSNFGPFDVRNAEVQIHCEGFRKSDDGELMSEDARARYLGNIITNLEAKAPDADNHFELMGSCLSSVFLVRFSPVSASRPDTVQQTLDLLRRLPPLPSQLELAYPIFHVDEDLDLRRYFVPASFPAELPLRNETVWQRLQVVIRFSDITLRVALLVILASPGAYNIGISIRNLVNLLAELLDLVSSGESAANKTDLLKNNMVKAYLWTTWTRCVLLLFWFVLRHQISFGFDDQWNQLLALRGTSTLLNPKIRGTLHGYGNQSVPYMCSWAFKVLKSNRAALTLDFRLFHQRYAEFHGDKPQRCIWGSEHMACSGGHPLECGRFQDKRLVSEEQSVHGPHTGSCRRLFWSRECYVSVQGPVAVSVAKLKNKNQVQYVQASERTMAISHVWSHGHGGRPHTGMNSCLHERFSSIARRLGCTSYWMDTLCIPDEHKLRAEAIGFINRVFAESRVVLVLDRDLMDIDILNPTLPILESTLATFLVCDWNVRAWTMLEAMKGCHNLHLLCQAERTLSLNECLQILHKEGRVDLVVLCLASQHLMPSSSDAFRRSSSRTSLEVAGSLLSHRHATRPGDEIVIWSLISNIAIYSSGESMWRGLIGRRIHTAFLMSNTARLEHVSGFSWAPETPYIRQPPPGTSMDLSGLYLVYDGADSEKAQITTKGLWGKWMIYRFQSKDAELYKDAPTSFITIGSDGKEQVSIFEGHRVTNQCWEYAARLASSHQEVLLLRPASIVGEKVYDLSARRGETHGVVFAVCVSDGNSIWRWKAVVEWPRTMPTPRMYKDEILIA